MRFCPNCGAQLDDSVKFCTSCGEKLAPMQAAPQQSAPQQAAPQQAAPQESATQQAAPQPQQVPPQPEQLPPEPQMTGQAPVPPQAPYYGAPANEYAYGQVQEPPKKKGNGILIGAAAAVGLCAVGGGAFFLLRGLGAKPSQEFLLYQKEAVFQEAMDNLEEGLDLLGKGEFSSDITLSGEVQSDNDFMGSMITGVVNDSSVGLKVNASGKSILANMDLNLMGSPVLDGVFTYDAGKVGFYIPALDDTYYTADMSAMLKNQGVDADLSTVSIPKFSGSEWRSIIEDYTQIACSAVTDENVTKETKVDFTLSRLGGDYTGTVYTWKPAAADIQGMIEKMADHLEEDEKLRTAVCNAANPEMVNMFMKASGDSSFDFEAKLEESLKQTAQEMRDGAEEAGKNLEKDEFSWTVSVADKKAKEIRISSKDGALLVMELDGDKEKDYSTAVYSEVSPDIDCVSHYTKEGTVYKGEGTSKSTEGDVKVAFEYDKAKKSVFGANYGTYDIDMDALAGSSIHLEVSGSEDGGADHILRMDNLSSLSDGYISDMTITLNATESSTAKAPESSVKTEDITDWSMSELEALFEKLGMSLEQNVLPNITSAIGF